MKSGDYIEIVALGAGQEERGNLICEVIGQGIDGPTNKSIRGGGHPESSSRPTRTAPPQPGPAMCCRRYMTLTRTACGAEPREGQQLQGGQRLRRSGTDSRGVGATAQAGAPAVCGANRSRGIAEPTHPRRLGDVSSAPRPPTPVCKSDDDETRILKTMSAGVAPRDFRKDFPRSVPRAACAAWVFLLFMLVTFLNLGWSEPSTLESRLCRGYSPAQRSAFEHFGELIDVGSDHEEMWGAHRCGERPRRDVESSSMWRASTMKCGGLSDVESSSMWRAHR